MMELRILLYTPKNKLILLREMEYSTNTGSGV